MSLSDVSDIGHPAVPIGVIIVWLRVVVRIRVIERVSRTRIASFADPGTREGATEA